MNNEVHPTAEVAVTIHVRRKLLFNKTYFSKLARSCEGCLQRDDAVQYVINQYQDMSGEDPSNQKKKYSLRSA